MSEPSMEQLAKELGVSKSLVSLALSGKYGVSEEMRTKIVLYAIQRGYDFSRRKGSKKKNTEKRAIGVLLDQDDLVTERFWPQILKGIESELYQNSIKMRVVVWVEDAGNENVVRDLAEAKYSGLIVLNKLPAQILDALSRLGYAVVVVDGKFLYETQYDTVQANNYAGGYIGAQYLIGKGHRHLMFLGYADFSRSFKARYHGFMDGVAAEGDTGIRVSNIICAGPNSLDPYDLIFNEAALQAAFADPQAAPTAIMCANDPIAMRAICTLENMGLKVPDDVSVVGFDNIRDSAFFAPKLTTFNVPKEEMGKAAVRLLLHRIQNPDEVIKGETLEVKLEERNSVRDLRSGSSK